MITADSLNVSSYDFIEQGEHGSVTPESLTLTSVAVPKRGRTALIAISCA